MRLVSEDDFDYLFAKRNEVYDYKSFIQSIAKFPYMCNDIGDGKAHMSDDDMCA